MPVASMRSHSSLRAELESADTLRAAAAPRIVIVTGPRGAGKTRWIQRCIRDLLEQCTEARCAVLLAEEGRARMEQFCAGFPGTALRKLSLPCLCCPAAADLPAAVRALVSESRADWIFVEVPAVAANGLLAEFDQQVGWPRSIVVCLNAAWAKAARSGMLSFFQSCLLDSADAVAIVTTKESLV
jgi:Ni2+-binding GTPase involved in maturation of urease and hydrogenase